MDTGLGSLPKFDFTQRRLNQLTQMEGYKNMSDEERVIVDDEYVINELEPLMRRYDYFGLSISTIIDRPNAILLPYSHAAGYTACEREMYEVIDRKMYDVIKRGIRDFPPGKRCRPQWASKYPRWVVNMSYKVWRYWTFRFGWPGLMSKVRNVIWRYKIRYARPGSISSDYDVAGNMISSDSLWRFIVL